MSEKFESHSSGDFSMHHGGAGFVSNKPLEQDDLPTAMEAEGNVITI